VFSSTYSSDTEARHAQVAEADFETYFHERASRFSSFYKSEKVARLLGRGPMYDRLEAAVYTAQALGVTSVLDVGCGSGPLFAPLAGQGIRVTGFDPADNMVAMAKREAAKFPGLVDVRQHGWEDLEDVDSYDLAMALGVFDYVDDAAGLLSRMGRAANHVVASFPAPGIRLELRKIRYGARGVVVHPYRATDFAGLAARAGMKEAGRYPLGQAGFVVHFSRPSVD
jgi:SAM-dependent methyltransferase